MKGVILGALTVMLAAASLFGGGQSESRDEASEPVTAVAVVARSLDDPVYIDARRAAEAVAEEFGVTLLWTAPPHPDSAEQVDLVGDLIEGGFDAILISPVDATRLRGAIDRAVEAGVAVGTFERDSPQSRRLFHVGTDQRRVGEVAAERLLHLTQGMRAPVDVAILRDTRDDSALAERLRGAEEALAGTDIRVAASLPAGRDARESAEAVASYNRLYPGLDAWLLIEGGLLLGDPAQAAVLSDFRRRGGLVVAADSHYPMLQAIADNTVDYLVGVDMAAMGDGAMRRLIQASRGGRITPQVVLIEPQIIDRNTAAEIRARKSPW